MKYTVRFALLVATAFFLIPSSAFASTGADAHHGMLVLAFLACVVLLAKLAGGLAERAKQVSVMGELFLGILLGVPALLGFHALDGFKDDSFVMLFAEFSVILLLFQVGLESNLEKMKSVGFRAFLVAIIGVVAPFALGALVVGPWLMPDASSGAHLFLGAALTATSVGLTARVFKDLGVGQSRAAQIVLGAAVIDDVLGLVILAVVSAIVTSGSVSVGTAAWLTFKAIAFLGVAIVLGRILAPRIGHALSKVQHGVGMKMAMALAFCMLYAYFSTLFGLAPIVGAFAAGLLLDPVHFKKFANPHFADEVEEMAHKLKDEDARTSFVNAIEQHRERHVEHLIEGIAQWVVPIFFVVTGLQVNLAVFADPTVVLTAAGFTIAAIVGKMVSGLAAGPGADPKVVGIGMVPRGEVGLIFANVGKSLGVVNEQMFAAVVVMVIVTTIITPLLLPWALRRSKTLDPLSSPDGSTQVA